MIRFVCTCGRQLQAREENAGKIVLCPACKQRVTVPNQAATSIQPEEPREPAAPHQRVQRERPALRDENESESEDRPRRREAGGSSGKAIASLILGILSFCGCTCLAGLPAIVLGILSLRDIGRATGVMTGKPMAIIGIVFGSLGMLCTPFGIYLSLFPAVQKVREAANRSQSQNNLKQMALAMHNYNAMYNGFPSAGIGDPLKPEPQRKPNLSWRVAILPLIDLQQDQLYRQFKLDEPWDGPNNIKLLAKMPKVYQLPGDDKTKPGHTHYQVFVGNGAAFDQTKGHGFADFPDGSSNTILIVEAENAVPWTKPEDVPFDPSQPVLPLMSRHFRSVFHVAMADGSVRAVVPQISEPTFKAAITRSGNEILGPDW